MKFSVKFVFSCTKKSTVFISGINYYIMSFKEIALTESLLWVTNGDKYGPDIQIDICFLGIYIFKICLTLF